MRAKSRKTPYPERDYAISTLLLMSGLLGIVHVATQPLSYRTGPVRAYTASRIAYSDPSSLPRSTPTRLKIPAIEIDAQISETAKKADGSLQVPDSYSEAGWYIHSPTPGEIGPAIITGHVDSYMGPAVFYRLQELEPGAHISVYRKDGSVAVFRVEKVAVFSQSDFPTDEVYGNISYAGLRLITCGGSYDYFSGRYSHNVVVYAALT